MLYFFFIGQSIEASWWRVCYQWGLPHLVFFHAPKLFVCLHEAPKHIFLSLWTPCITCFPSYLTLKISPLTSFLSKVVRLLGRVFMVKISLKCYKICFMPYSTTLSIKQDRNSTYRWAFRGLRIYNLFNLFSLPIWVTFKYEWHSILSNIPVWVTFHFEWNSFMNDIQF